MVSRPGLQPRFVLLQWPFSGREQGTHRPRPQSSSASYGQERGWKEHSERAFVIFKFFRTDITLKFSKSLFLKKISKEVSVTEKGAYWSQKLEHSKNRNDNLREKEV